MQRIELNGLDRRSVAERVRVLVSGFDSLSSAARRLGVEPHLLEIATAEQAPYPTLELLDAVVNVMGVDPTWLVTGRYDPGTHRSALENEDGEAQRVLRAVLRVHATPTSVPAVLDEPRGRHPLSDTSTAHP